ncbi:MAG: Gfo/Idh/MocA family oxidoreductase [Lentisphaeria bacterium]|nr:Gfo/Idh/MocA family oxidoreductase [Lentisphaeria bacterium]
MRIGIVGTGKVARDCYLPVLAKEKDVELAYFSRTSGKAQACAEAFGGTVCESLRALVDWGPDSIFVLTNETTRADVLEELLPLQPRRLFLEKPLVARHGQDNVDEEDFATARRLLDKAAAVSCETAMIFNYRFFDQTLAARDIVASRNFGEPVAVQASVNYACWSHCIDLALFFVGPVATVSALTGPREHRHGQARARDVAAALTFRNGASGTILGTWGMNFAFPLYELTVHYERGRFHGRGLDGDLEVFDYAAAVKRHEVHALTRNTSRWDQYKASFGKSIRAYLQSLREGTPPPVPGLAGLEELQFEAALRRSARQGRQVNVEAEFPLQAGGTA